jgi:hypothetical protein
MSLLAGYPSALAISQALARWVGKLLGEEPSLEGVPVRVLAERFEAAFGRAELLDVFAAVNSQPRGVDPTPAHRYAVRLVDLIVTTNFDPLFEVAAREGGIAFSRVIPPEGFGWPPERQVIVKILGAIEERHTMVVTERDLRRAIESEPYCTVMRLARELPLLVVGTSLRDEAQKVILRERPAAMAGYFVCRTITAFERRWLTGMGVEPIEADADSFFRALDVAVQQARPAA